MTNKENQYHLKAQDVPRSKFRERILMQAGSGMKNLFLVLMISLMMLGIAGCAAGPNDMVNSPDEEGKVSGF